MSNRRGSFVGGSVFGQSTAGISADVSEFSDKYDETAPPVGMDMAGHDTFLLGPKTVMLDSFVVDLLHVDTSAQTFKLKLLVNMDWEDDGTIEPEYKAKRNLGRTGTSNFLSRRSSHTSDEGGDPPSSFPRYIGRTTTNMSNATDTYKTGKYVLKPEFGEDPLTSTWSPEVVLVNAIADEDPIAAGSKFHCIQMLNGRPVISRSVLYQPECRCAFSFANFPFDETDLRVKLSSNKWNAEHVNFMWSHRLGSMGNPNYGKRPSQHFHGIQASSLRRESSYLRRTVDENAIGGVGLSEFEIVRVRVESDEKDVNSMQRYDNDEGAFSEAHLVIRVRRDPYSYLLRVATVAELLMFLEVLSFLTDNGDLSARFSISGTIFLAMVSLYGPMADALPKVSVVTRVDKWHLSNFVLLFASNVENLLAFLLRNHIKAQFIEYVEVILALLYTYLVVTNLLWFIDPLKDREEFSLIVVWFEDRLDRYQEKWAWLKTKAKGCLPWNWKKKEKEKEKHNADGAKVTATAARAAVRFKGGIKHKGSNGSNGNEAMAGGVSWDPRNSLIPMRNTEMSRNKSL